ncbi:TRAP transporter, DctM subunit [Lutimaribacter pacificus]|uniref:TRAP transporter, DctM subunit n=1 Tax=Lutimaribacter pacificus TaxID=391948 RepID=A0A1H0M3Q1_9RHOB|nr:TRAP transporter large permease subunit [Lutimaribacter pacificus]SDO74836.1 TRAP transporter, DctM subunit [Lutimaribacter pacificus]SHK77235.1 TRAP transporter, DctM subunit [Lutimaribacter pacificus]
MAASYLPILVMSVGLIVMFALSVPIYISFLCCNLMAVMLMMGPAGSVLFVNSISSTATSYTLVPLPAFILMGEILYRGNAVGQMLTATDRLIGGFRGRHFVLGMSISTILATMSGSAMGSAAMLSRSVYPEMRSRGYDQKMSVGVLIGGACLAPIIPPSVLAILISILAQMSVKDMFVAGIIPGLMIFGMIIVYILVRVALRPDIAPIDEDYRRPSAREIIGAIGKLLPFTLVIIFVVGSIILGIATPIESAVAGVFGAMIVALIFGRLSLRMMIDALQSTTLTTTMVIVIMFSSQLFTQLLGFSGTSRLISSVVADLDLPDPVMLLIMMAIPFVLCMLLDEIAAMLILIPIYLTILPHMEIEPIAFWVLFLINMTVGAMTPPVGYVLFVIRGVIGDISMQTIFSAVLPYVLIFLLAMVILATFPQLLTMLL